MADFERTLIQLNENLQILLERESKYGGSAPLDLLAQIRDHRAAIALTKQAIAGDLAEAGWREQLRPLLLPFWQGLSDSVLAALIEAAQSAAPPAPAAALRQTALAHLQHTPKGALLAEEFSADPDTWRKPVQKELAEQVQTNPAFAVHLHRLLARIEAGDSTSANISGSGAIAQGPGASAAHASGPGSIAIGGSVGGDVTLPGEEK